MTMGLMAGAARRNVRAAPWGIPRETRRPATGTELHSQPGSSAPAAPAAGTASAVWRGTARAIQEAGTSAEMTALITVPSTRNGMAWRVRDTKMVDQLRRAWPSNR